MNAWLQPWIYTIKPTGGLPTPTPITPDAPVCTHGLKARLATILRYIEWLKMERWLLCGEELHSREKLIVLYTGVAQNKNYFAGLVFAGNYTEKYLGRWHFWQLSNHLDKDSRDCSLVVTEGLKIFGKPFQKKGYFYIPGWIKGKIEMPDDFSGLIKNRSIASDISRIKRNHLVCQVTRDMSCFNRFYHEMYLPVTQTRHGGAAFIHTYEEIRRKFRQCVLVLVKKDDTAIAGIMVSHDKTRGHLWILGVTGGKSEYIQAGAMPALYYYSLKFLHAQGCRQLDIGSTRAFLNDGVLGYKKKWGFQIVGESPAGFFLKVMQASPGLSSFLRYNPFIVTGKDGNNAVFFRGSEEAAGETSNNLQGNYWPKGLDGVIVRSLAPDAGIKQVSKTRI